MPHKHKTYVPLCLHKYTQTGSAFFCRGDCKPGDDNVVDIFTLKVKHQGKHCPSTVTVCEHKASMTQTQTPPLLAQL